MSETINVNIMGVPYTLKAGDDPTYVTRLGEYVDKMMSELSASAPKLSQLQVAVLTSLNLADLLQRAQEANHVIDRANTRIRRILEQME